MIHSTIKTFHIFLKKLLTKIRLSVIQKHQLIWGSKTTKNLVGLLDFSRLGQLFLIVSRPDETFPNVRATPSGDRRILCCPVIVRRIFKLQSCERVRRAFFRIDNGFLNIEKKIESNMLPAPSTFWPPPLLPSRLFHKSLASKSGDWWILCSSETSCDGFWSSAVVKGLVGFF